MLDIQTGICDQPQIGQYIRQTNEVMVITSGPPVWQGNRRQSKQVFHAQRQAHKEMIFHLRNRNHFCTFKTGTKGIPIKHQSATRHVVLFKRWCIGIDKKKKTGTLPTMNPNKTNMPLLQRAATSISFYCSYQQP